MIDGKTVSGSSLTAFFAWLGFSAQDWIALTGMLIAAGFTARSYYVGRKDAAEKKAEEMKRTAIIEKMYQEMDAANPTASTMKVAEILTKSEGVMSNELTKVLSE